MSTNLATTNWNYSTTSESAFIRLVDDIGRTLEPTQTQLESLERSYKSTGEYLVSCDEFKGYLEEIHPHGSRALGTMTRPLGRGEGFDIDLMARLNRSAWTVYSGSNGAAVLLNRLHTAVDRYANQHRLKLVKWQRCVTLEYADGMCADIAPVIDMPHLTALHGETHAIIPDRELHSFHPTNPRGFIRLFDAIAAIKPAFLSPATEALANDVRKAEIAPLPSQDVFQRLLCRLIQVTKLHRDVAFNEPSLKDLRPSSIFITALLAGAYEARARIPHRDQLDLMLDVLRTMPTLIRVQRLASSGEEWFLDNPTAPGDNLASGMNRSELQQAFRQWHTRLLEDVSKLLQVIDSRQGVDRVTRLVASTFGEKAAAAVRREELARHATARGAGLAASVTTSGIILPMAGRNHTFFGV